MSALESKNRGWDVREASKLCLAPDLLSDYENKTKAWVEAGSRKRRPNKRSFWDRDPANPDRDIKEREGYQRYLERKASAKAVTAAFRQMMMSEKLFAWGRQGRSSADLKPIPSSSWKYLKFRRDSTQVKDIDETLIVDVQVFPFVKDLSAPQRLAGLSLSKAFRISVLDDPEVQARGTELKSRVGHHDVFEKGQFPGPVVRFIWPIQTSPKMLEDEFTRRMLYGIGDESETTPEEVVKASAVLSDRWEALRAHLINGDIVAQGTFTKTGLVQPIPRQQWSRATIGVDVQNGDVLEEAGNKHTLVWAGVELVLPGVAEKEEKDAPKTHEAVRQLSDLPIPTSRTQASIFEAVKNLWPDGIPRGLTQQQRNEMIREEQRRLRHAPASDKSFQRYLD